MLCHVSDQLLSDLNRGGRLDCFTATEALHGHTGHVVGHMSACIMEAMGA